MVGKVQKIIPIKIDACDRCPPMIRITQPEVDFTTATLRTGARGQFMKQHLRCSFEVPTLGNRLDQQKERRQNMNFPIHMNDLGAFVAHLRREGFDARSDLFNKSRLG